MTSSIAAVSPLPVAVGAGLVSKTTGRLSSVRLCSFPGHFRWCSSAASGRTKLKWRRFVVRGCQGEQSQSQNRNNRRSFLSMEEAGLVEMSGLSTHERFLCRLTISSLNLLRVISEQEGVPIEELNAGRVCDWFLKDKLKREQNLESAVLQWDDSGFGI